MSARTSLLLVAALVLAVFTAILMHGWINAQRAALDAANARKAAPAAGTQVLVAKEDLPVGRFVRATDLAWQPWPAKGIAPAYAVQGKRPEKDFFGAVVRHAILAGQPVTDDAVVKPGDRGFLAAVLTPGDRAVSVKVSATSGIADLIFPGDHVDIILTQTLHQRERDQSIERHASLTVLRDIRVLAIDQNLADQETTDAKSGKPTRVESGNSHTATLEVTPKQGEIVAVAVEMGNLSLELRSLASPGQNAVADATGAGGTAVATNATGATGATGAAGAALDPAPEPVSDPVTDPASDRVSDPAAPVPAPAVTTYTLDNDVSRLLPPLQFGGAPPPAAHPRQEAPQTQTVVVLRGSRNTKVSTPAAAPYASAAPYAPAGPGAPGAPAAPVAPVAPVAPANRGVD